MYLEIHVLTRFPLYAPVHILDDPLHPLVVYVIIEWPISQP